MSSALIVCLFLSLALTVASLMVMHLQRQRRGMQEIIRRVLSKEVYHADDDPNRDHRVDHDSYVER